MTNNLQTPNSTRAAYENVQLDTSTENCIAGSGFQGNSVNVSESLTGQTRGYQNVTFNFDNNTQNTRNYNNILDLDDRIDSTVQTGGAPVYSNGNPNPCRHDDRPYCGSRPGPRKWSPNVFN